MNREHMGEPPDPEVLRAFDASGKPVRLPGGQGSTFVVGDLVLKPVADADEARWIAEVLENLVADGFRVPRPVHAQNGDWVAGAWTGWTLLEGEHRLWGGPWSEAIKTSRRSWHLFQ